MSKAPKTPAFSVRMAFRTREEHRDAIDWTNQVGSQPGIPAVAVLPPLYYTSEELAWRFIAGAAWPRVTGGRWHEMACAVIDGRAPWRTEPKASIQKVRGVGYIIIRDARPQPGYRADLLRVSANGDTTDHALVDRDTRKRVIFDTVQQAENDLQATVNADGRPPSDTWAWSPEPSLVPEKYPWRAMPDRASTPLSGSEVASITRSAPGGHRWIIEDSRAGVFVLHDRQMILDSATGQPRDFGSVDSAKLYCSREDAP